jgi:TonB-dependent starch-binding outer membrane protein SusC
MNIVRIPSGVSVMAIILLISSGRLSGQETSNGFNSQKTRDLTGSVSVIDSAKLTLPATGNITKQLQGLASGVNVTGNGQPGTDANVRIRGFSSFFNNDPLYIVDGVPSQEITTLNPADIDQISILKDAGAATIYGSSAPDGVIVITTKRGSAGFSLNYNMYLGTRLPGKGTADQVLNTQEYADLQWLVYKNDGTTEYNPIYGPSSDPSPIIPYWAGNTDWYKEITR